MISNLVSVGLVSLFPGDPLIPKGTSFLILRPGLTKLFKALSEVSISKGVDLGWPNPISFNFKN